MRTRILRRPAVVCLALVAVAVLAVAVSRFFVKKSAVIPARVETAISPRAEILETADVPAADAHLYPPVHHFGHDLIARPLDVADAIDDGPADERDGTNVQDIDVRGCVRVSESRVLRAIRTRVGRPFEMKVWCGDWHRMDDMGEFVNVRVTEPVSIAGGLRLTVELVEKPVIDSIRIMGVDEATKAELKRVMRSDADGAYDRGQLHLDCRAMEEWLEHHGYFGARVVYAVEPISSRQQRIGDKYIEVEDVVRVEFTVSPRVFVRIRSLTLENVTAFSTRDLLNEINSKRNGWFVAAEVNSDRERLAAFYAKNGYADIAVGEAKIAEAGDWVSPLDGHQERLVDVSFAISEGAQHVIGGVRFEGNAEIDARELERVVLTKPSALLIDDVVRRDQERLILYYCERGWFNVDVSAIRTRVTDPKRLEFSANLWDVAFQISEGKKPVKLAFATDPAVKTEPVELDTTRGNFNIQALKGLDIALEKRTEKGDDAFAVPPINLQFKFERTPDKKDGDATLPAIELRLQYMKAKLQQLNGALNKQVAPAEDQF